MKKYIIGKIFVKEKFLYFECKRYVHKYRNNKMSGALLHERNIVVTTLFFVTALFTREEGVTADHNMFGEKPEQFTGTDVSFAVFGDDNNDVFPVAYFDVNSDKLTDIVAVSRERTSINIFLAANDPPYIRRAFSSKHITKGHDNKKIISVRPGDFTGNGVADLMVVLGNDEYTWEEFNNGTTAVDLIFCSILLHKKAIMDLKCGEPGSGSVIKGLTQEPTVLDLNGDMVLDLIGEKWIELKLNNNKVFNKKQRMLWFSESTKDSFEWQTESFRMAGPFANETLRDMTNVSSNAYADIDGDSIPELLILTEDPMVGREKAIYYLETYNVMKDDEERIVFSLKKPPELVETFPQQNETKVIGQPMLIDFEHNGKMQHMFPYCTNLKCDKEFGIYVMDQGKALPLPLGSLTFEGVRWSFIPPPAPPKAPKPHNLTNTTFSIENFYSRSLSLRVGDYNLDGFPDLLGVLKTGWKPGEVRNTRAVLFENVRCVPSPESPCHYNRTFMANFEIFKEYKTVVSASFYDVGDNGAIDVILVTLPGQQQQSHHQRFAIQAFENGMNFDASFLKVMVLTGQLCLECEGGLSYGSVLPGATIRYSSLNTKGVEESGLVVQTYRTSHMPLDLPCNVFGIGHSPNFIESLTVSIAPNRLESYRREWKQIIPNSQIVVVPNPLQRPHRWTMKLFLTPSDVVLKTFGILIGVCLVLATLAAALEFKEKREDRRARQSEAHRILWLR